MRKSYNTLRDMEKVDAWNEPLVHFPSEAKINQLTKLFELSSGILVHGFVFPSIMQ